MNNMRQYVVKSLELHLFFARIMKEHALFLLASFTPVNNDYAKAAEKYKIQFEDVLSRTVSLSEGLISPEVLESGEIYTEFTLCAEQQTQNLTGICIDKRITKMEQYLRCGITPVDMKLADKVKQLNRTVINLLNGLIQLKENVLSQVLSCQMFTMNYPLLIKHIIREAKLYRSYVMNFENGEDLDCQNMKQVEQFWNQIMMEHALFIRGLLDPSENELIETSNEFAKDYSRLLEKTKCMNDMILNCNRDVLLEETIKFRDFKAAGTKGIQECKIQSIILPLLADHVLREANHYIRLLRE